MRGIWWVLLALVVAVPAGAADFAVVGGQPVEDGRWPTVVALVRAEQPDDVVGQFCGGTAIGPELVLTAAHCFHDDAVEAWRQPTDVRVVAGRSDLRSDGGVERTGVHVWLHPDYDPRSRRNDVAVLLVDGPLGVPLQSLADPGGAGPFEGDRATVLGWGRTSPDRGSRPTDVLQAATVDVVGDDRCRTAFDGDVDLGVQLCAGGGGSDRSPAPDACGGDSGGPLLVRDAEGHEVQQGITSYGPARCGVGDPGVYTRVAAVRPFVEQVIAGHLAPTVLPEPAPAHSGRREPIRIAATVAGPTTAIDQAVASSRAVFLDGGAELAVLARDDGYPDALAGSALGYGLGPLLFTPSQGPLAPATRGELQRVLGPGATVYLLGGEAAVPAGVEDELRGMGLVPRRIAGPTREATAAAVAREVVRRHGDGQGPPFDTVIVATSGTWPDAVVAGQLAVWWGFPVLLTPSDVLHPAAASVLADSRVTRILVVGGEGAVGDEVLGGIGTAAGGAVVQRLSGSDRIGTALAVAGWQRQELAAVGEPAPDTVAAVNLRRDDGYAHVLAATSVIGATAGVFLPVEGEAGDTITTPTADAFCGAGGLPLIIGGTDLVADGVDDHVADLLAGIGC